MSMNPIFLIVAVAVIFGMLSTIFGKKGAGLIVGSVLLFGYILNSVF